MAHHLPQGQFKQLSKELQAKVNRKFQLRKVVTFEVNEIWSCDLADVSSLKDANDGNAFILVCVDVFSRFVRCAPLKNKSAISVLHAFESFDTHPKKIWVDQGKEFYNNLMKKYCQERDIVMYSTSGVHKSVYAERFNRTLKDWLSKYFISNNTYNWLGILQELVDTYNNRVHSTTGVAPVDAIDPENYMNVYVNNIKYRAEKVKEQKRQDKNDLHIGDYVRTSRVKGVFEKGYHSNWTEEVFVITHVIDSTPKTYKIAEAFDGTPIEGSFYRSELQKTSDPRSVDLRAEVIKEDKKNKRNKIHYIGFPDKYDEWVSTE